MFRALGIFGQIVGFTKCYWASTKLGIMPVQFHSILLVTPWPRSRHLRIQKDICYFLPFNQIYRIPGLQQWPLTFCPCLLPVTKRLNVYYIWVGEGVRHAEYVCVPMCVFQNEPNGSHRWLNECRKSLYFICWKSTLARSTISWRIKIRWDDLSYIPIKPFTYYTHKDRNYTQGHIKNICKQEPKLIISGS